MAGRPTLQIPRRVRPRCRTRQTRCRIRGYRLAFCLKGKAPFGGEPRDMRRLFVVVTLGIALAGCASLGLPEQVMVTTKPSGATLEFSNGKTCTSPCSVYVRPGHPVEVTATHDGCDIEHHTLALYVDHASAQRAADAMTYGILLPVAYRNPPGSILMTCGRSVCEEDRREHPRPPGMPPLPPAETTTKRIYCF